MRSMYECDYWGPASKKDKAHTGSGKNLDMKRTNVWLLSRVAFVLASSLSGDQSTDSPFHSAADTGVSPLVTRRDHAIAQAPVLASNEIERRCCNSRSTRGGARAPSQRPAATQPAHAAHRQPVPPRSARFR